MSRPKFYGIILVSRRIYILCLIVLFILLLKTIFSFTIKQPSIDEQVNKKYGSENIDCVIEAVYHEARGEDKDGWKAVSEIIINRMNNEQFPNTMCEVVKQNKQFSYRNGNKKFKLTYDNPHALYEISTTIYNHIYEIDKNHKNRLLPECAINYDGKSFKKPKWASQMKMVKEIGGHQFYCKK